VELGFDTCSEALARRPLPRPAFVAFEYRPGWLGPALVAVDAARGARTLRARYPDHTRVLVARATVDSWWNTKIAGRPVVSPAPWLCGLQPAP